MQATITVGERFKVWSHHALSFKLPKLTDTKIVVIAFSFWALLFLTFCFCVGYIVWDLFHHPKQLSFYDGGAWWAMTRLRKQLKKRR